MTKDEALKMAIAFMETLTIDTGIKTWNEKHRKEALNACKEALEHPAQEPVAYLSTDSKANEIIKTYQAQPLSDDEILSLLSWQLWREMPNEIKIALVRDIEQAHGIGVKDE